MYNSITNIPKQIINMNDKGVINMTEECLHCWKTNAKELL